MGAWYRAGTVAVTNGDVHVTGTNTLWTTQASQGDIFSLDGDKFYEIASITDDTHLVLQTAFLGATASAQSYEIIRNFTSTTNAQLASNLAGMLDQWHQYLDDMLGWLGGTGTVTVHDANNTAHTVKTPAQIEAETDGVLSLSVAGGVDVTLTDTQFGHRQFVLTGALTANINVIAPASEPRVINVWNQTTGAFTLTIKTAASGSTGVTVAPGARADILIDGTNAYFQNTTAAINTGAIDGVVIGANNPAAATFTHVTLTDASGLNLNAGAQASTITLNGSDTDGGWGRYIIRTGTQHTAWRISAQDLLNEAFEITPSASHGGEDFNTAAFIVRSNGHVQIGGQGQDSGDPFQVYNGHVNVIAGGIRLNNGTAVLQNYEEGTFTPTLAGSTTAGSNTYQVQSGVYTRVGRTVHFKIYVRLSAKDAAMAGNIQVNGLPYTSNATTSSYGAVTIGMADAITLSTGKYSKGAYIAPGASNIYLLENTSGGSATADQVANYANTSGLIISGTYTI